MDPPSVDVVLANNPATVDPPPPALSNVLATVDPPPPFYTTEQQSYLKSIEQQAAEIFTQGNVYATIKELREQLRSFGQKQVSL
jgi:hypothetical protein